MKIVISIPEIKMNKDLLIVNSDNDKKIVVDDFSSTEKSIYDKFIRLTENSDQFQIDNTEIDLFIHRVCSQAATEDKYIDYNELSTASKKIVDSFVELVKNK